jgi:glycosyltransferase involved in cell wall biosynthesis
MRKILLVTRPICPPWDEASKNFAFYLAQNVSGFEFYLLANGILPNLPENIHQKPIYTANSFSYFQKLRLLKHLRKMKNDFDVIHYLFTPTKQNSFLIRNLVKSHKTKTIQTIATLREDLYSEKDWKKIIFADLIITYSRYAKDKLEKLGFNNVKQVYPGIDVELFSPAPKKPELMEKFNLSENDFVINFTGEYSRGEAIDDVIDSFLEISKKIPNAKLSLAVRIKNPEDARKKKEVVETLKRNNVLDKVSFQDDGTYVMQEIFNLCDVSLFPIKNMHGKFDVPLAVIEAMACEKPVIISNIPILKEFANDQNSVTIEAGNVEQLVQAIEGLYLDKTKREMIGKNARQFVEDNFDIRKIGEKYKEIYESL